MRFIDLVAQQQRLRPSIDSAIARVLDHGAYINGPEVAELEARLGEWAGVEHVVGVSSGTDALVMALMVRGVGPGDAVYVPAFTFAATAEAVALLGATPVFVDVELETANMSASSFASAVEATPTDLRRAGVIIVDLFGRAADVDRLGAVAADNSLWVIADAAQSFGGTLAQRPVGSLAPLSTTSFFPAKPLGCYGDGGAVFAASGDDADSLRSLRVHGSGRHKYDTVRVGLNARLDTMQAAILLEKLTVFADELSARNAVAARYEELLGDIVSTPAVPESGSTCTWAQYTIRCEDRDRVAEQLKSEGVPTAVYYERPLHRQPAYERCPAPVSLDGAAELSRTVLSLPMHPYLSTADQDRVVAALHRAVGSPRIGNGGTGHT